MRGRRNSSTTTMSLFSFQDIITSVTAIMICIALLMSIELLVKMRQSGPATTGDQIERTRDVSQEMDLEINALLRANASVETAFSNLPSLDKRTLSAAADRREVEAAELEAAVADSEERLRRGEAQLEDRKAAVESDGPQLAADLEKLRRELEEAEAKAAAIANDDRLFFRVAEGQKMIWLGELTTTHMMFARIGVSEPPLTYSSATETAFEKWLRELDKSSNAFLLIVKSGGESRYKRLRERLLLPGDDGEHFDVGVQVAPESQQFIDPQKGAGPP